MGWDGADPLHDADGRLTHDVVICDACDDEMSAPMTRSETFADKSTGRREMAKVVSSSLIGTTIEYDFFLFGSASALVFNRLRS